MSARDDIVAYFAGWTATPVLMLDDYVSLDDLPATALEQMQVVLDFPSAQEVMASIAVIETNCYRESGIFQMMLLSPLGADQAPARTRCEELRTFVRAKRIGSTVIQTVDTFSSVAGDDGKWRGWISIASYYRDHFT